MEYLVPLLWRCDVLVISRGYSSIGRAPPLHGGGSGFEPPWLHLIHFETG